MKDRLFRQTVLLFARTARGAEGRAVGEVKSGRGAKKPVAVRKSGGQGYEKRVRGCGGRIVRFPDVALRDGLHGRAGGIPPARPCSFPCGFPCSFPCSFPCGSPCGGGGRRKPQNRAEKGRDRVLYRIRLPARTAVVYNEEERMKS